jgi:hypothetical protein
MTRRDFIKIISGSGIAIATGYLVVTDFYDVVDRLIRKELAYLRISYDVYDKFISEVRREKAINHFGKKKEWFIGVHFTLGEFISKILPYRYKYEQYQNDIIATFLLSTDFFLNNMNENRSIKYIGLYHPYKQACSNPFSANFYSS